MKLPPDEESRLTINIVPMIDVVFAILAFFILSTLYLTRAEGLPVNLPTATTAVSQAEAALTLTIRADGQLYLANEPVTLETLSGDVQALMAPGQPATVTVWADAATPHGQVVAAMDQIRGVPGVRVGIATQQPPR